MKYIVYSPNIYVVGDCFISGLVSATYMEPSPLVSH